MIVQDYVQQMPKYSHLDYDNVIKKYDQDSVANIIKKEESNGWKCDNQGNIIGIINQREVA
jgi:shikimate kinase